MIFCHIPGLLCLRLGTEQVPPQPFGFIPAVPRWDGDTVTAVGAPPGSSAPDLPLLCLAAPPPLPPKNVPATPPRTGSPLTVAPGKGQAPRS